MVNIPLRINLKKNNGKQTIEVKSFKMDKYEVSNIWFVKFLNDYGNRKIENDYLYNPPITQDENKKNFRNKNHIQIYQDTKTKKWLCPKKYEYYPINWVTWYGADSYCSWKKKRLPSHNEWRFAAGGKNHTLFANGDMIDPKAYCFNTDESCIIGSFKPNSYGLFDMNGNVSEWTATKLKRTKNSGLYSGSTFYYISGGAWTDKCGYSLRTINETSLEQRARYKSIGFRCASDI